MTCKNDSGVRARCPGWVWVWAILVIFVALEVARLS